MVRSAAVRGSGRGAVIAASCALLLFGGCDGGGSGAERSDPKGSDPRGSGVVPTASADADILGRRDAAPEDVAALLSFTPPAGDFELCDPAGGPGLTFRARVEETQQLLAPSAPLEVGLQVLVCAYDVTAGGGPATATITDATGRVVRERTMGVEPTGGGGTSWFPKLDDVGPHHVQVRQAGLLLGQDIEVFRASSPRLMRLDEDNSRSPAVHVGLAGYPPDSIVPIALYRFDSGRSEGVMVTYEFVSQFDVPVNGNGEGVAVIPTDAATSHDAFTVARAGITMDLKARGHAEMVPFHVTR